jgi:hypothetical protein
MSHDLHGRSLTVGGGPCIRLSCHIIDLGIARKQE